MGGTVDVISGNLGGGGGGGGRERGVVRLCTLAYMCACACGGE